MAGQAAAHRAKATANWPQPESLGRRTGDRFEASTQPRVSAATPEAAMSSAASTTGTAR
ncbi:hypothetical protein PUR28_19965 [Streptomyces sp. BE308]|uniref:hypothetical protein n=1 Tax=Streptomyces sp. BE308 TaxID=3002529 RepID=UPI002E760741|nr:hypothetical protein [Streptomyces sp. BE308]MEE1793003.1 hypothetical protein [Streptomyces sp. BE308]